jgi:parallel beta-helix repeat protein
MRTPSVGGGIKWYFTINENGSVCPAGLPIVQNGNRYTLTGDIEGSLKILRDNIVVDGTGHRIFGNGSAMGGGNVVINGRDHVIFMNAVVSGFFGTGISLGSFDVNRSNSMIGSSNCLVANNTITGGSPSYCFSIWVEGLNNSIINNRIVGNNGIGVLIERGSHHLVANNLIEDNGMYGIGFEMGQATVKGNRLNNNAGGAFYFTDSNMGLITPIQ